MTTYSSVIPLKNGKVNGATRQHVARLILAALLFALLACLPAAGFAAVVVFDSADTISGDATNPWTSDNTLSNDSVDKKEGAASLVSTGSGIDKFRKQLTSPINTGMTVSNGYLHFWLYVSDVDAIESLPAAGYNYEDDLNPSSYELNVTGKSVGVVDSTCPTTGITTGAAPANSSGTTTWTPAWSACVLESTQDSKVKFNGNLEIKSKKGATGDYAMASRVVPLDGQAEAVVQIAYAAKDLHKDGSGDEVVFQARLSSTDTWETIHDFADGENASVFNGNNYDLATELGGVLTDTTEIRFKAISGGNNGEAKIKLTSVTVDGTAFVDAQGQIEITSSGGPDTAEYNWAISASGVVNGQQLVNGWNDLHLPISAADGPGATLSQINYFRVYFPVTNSITTKVDYIRFSDEPTGVPVIAGINPLPEDDENLAPNVCSASGDTGSAPSSGIVNTYYPATASVSAAGTSIELGTSIGSTTPISAGDLVMIIQMQDAVIDESNDVNYGDGAAVGSNDASGSTDIHQTGLYEFAIAATFGGTTLTVTDGLTHAYNIDTNQTFQVIRVPRYGDLTLSGNLTSEEWDGSAGGVVVIDVLGTLNFNGNDIDVFSAGFRGGSYLGGASNGESVVGPDYRIGPSDDGVDNNDFYGEKGEGIAGTSAISHGGDGYPPYLADPDSGLLIPSDLARGAPGNAGGGGNDHNGGGGGGSNIGHGGQGGDGWSAATDAGGKGGGLFDGYSGRLLLGGGGGAANANNNLVAGTGGNGGGLVFVNATTITGTGTVNANGSAGVDSNILNPGGNDGGGGGGGGGTIVIRTASASVNNLTLNAAGGKGGDVITPNPHGPGGGGGGGAVYIDATGATIDTSGGVAGIFYDTDSTPPAASGNHGALPGDDGHSLPLTDVPNPVACDYPDEDGYDSTTTVHQIDGAGGDATGLTIGSRVDFESAGLGGGASDATGDDNNDSSGSSAGNDEDAVVFALVPGNSSEMTATVTYNNPTLVDANLCGWMDINTNGAYESSEGFCVSVAPTVGTASEVMTFTGLSTVSTYFVYARFRITTDSLTTSNASGTTVTDGESESYRVDVDPTAVTIGKVELTATSVNDLLAGLNVDGMSTAELLALLVAWDPDLAKLMAGASRQTVLNALADYLDPDGDGQVALLRWETLEERGTIGFFVERKEGNARWLRINNEMLPGMITAPMGAEYMLADPEVSEPGIYLYRLTEQEAWGSTRTYGPYMLEIQR
ncbi:MAG: hypothetical protein GY732_14000 [Gammaproteobacteria bacterium]|nr:hypothetical protein [Gammaproteobacteria bacterium]